MLVTLTSEIKYIPVLSLSHSHSKLFTLECDADILLSASCNNRIILFYSLFFEFCSQEQPQKQDVQDRKTQSQIFLYRKVREEKEEEEMQILQC